MPDVLGRVKPVLRSLLPGRGDEPRVIELKPWARRTVRVYVLALVPLLGGLLVLLALITPRMVATVWDALGLQTDRLRDAAGDGEVAAGTLAVVQSISLRCRWLGLALSLGRIGRRSVGGLVRWARGSVWRSGVGLAGSLALVAGWRRCGGPTASTSRCVPARRAPSTTPCARRSRSPPAARRSRRSAPSAIPRGPDRARARSRPNAARPRSRAARRPRSAAARRRRRPRRRRPRRRRPRRRPSSRLRRRRCRRRPRRRQALPPEEIPLEPVP